MKKATKDATASSIQELSLKQEENGTNHDNKRAYTRPGECHRKNAAAGQENDSRRLAKRMQGVLAHAPSSRSTESIAPPVGISVREKNDTRAAS